MTGIPVNGGHQAVISIHTALAGCDDRRGFITPSSLISIHTALAGCDGPEDINAITGEIFQSTQPSQAVTTVAGFNQGVTNISIHTALAGCD